MKKIKVGLYKLFQGLWRQSVIFDMITDTDFTV